MVNKVILIGNLGRDPEVRKLDNGSTVGRFSVATNESYMDKNNEWQTITEWHNIVVWRNLAERAERQLKKGSMVFVEGKLTTRKWQDQNGADKYTTEVVANTFRILERKDNNNSIGGPPLPGAQDENRVSTPSPVSNAPTQQPAAEEDDLPF